MATVAFQKLLDKIRAESTEIASAVAFIKGVPQMIRDAVANASTAGQTSEEALLDLAAQIDADTNSVAAALAENTPSAPPAAPAPDATTAPANAPDGTLPPTT